MSGLVDLTRPMRADMAVYPQTPAPRFDVAHTVERDGFRETEFCFYSHTGTHIDAPAHMLRGGKTLDQYPAERFIGGGVVVDLSGFGRDEAVTLERLTPFEQGLLGRGAAVILFDTGYDADLDPYGACALPDLALLRAAVRQGTRVVGIDRMSIDAMDSTDMARHRLLFDLDVIIIENLKGLSALRGAALEVVALPLLVENADGAPARVFARRME